MREIEVKIRQIIWAFKISFRPTTYDRVEYKGDYYYIKSSLVGENIWNLFKKDAWLPTYRNILGNEFKIKNSLKRHILVFKFHLNFQKLN